MNIEQMARDAGIEDYIDDACLESTYWLPSVKRFAALLIEECAKTCDERAWGFGEAANNCAEALRIQAKEISE